MLDPMMLLVVFTLLLGTTASQADSLDSPPGDVLMEGNSSTCWVEHRDEGVGFSIQYPKECALRVNDSSDDRASLRIYGKYWSAMDAVLRIEVGRKVAFEEDSVRSGDRVFRDVYFSGSLITVVLHGYPQDSSAISFVDVYLPQAKFSYLHGQDFKEATWWQIMTTFEMLPE
jgi:hypothetical protein